MKGGLGRRVGRHGRRPEGCAKQDAIGVVPALLVGRAARELRAVEFEPRLQSEFGAETMEIPEESIVHVTQRVKIGFRRMVSQRPRYLESVGKGPKAFFDYNVSIIPTRNFSTRAYRVLN
jgi:hypothetical protein